MVIKQFKKLVLSLILLSQVGTLLPMAPVHVPEQGVLSALAADTFSLLKGAAYCVAAAVQGLGKTYLLARNNPVPALAVAVGVPLLGRYIYVRKYNEHIKPVVDRSRADGRVYTKWASDLWENQSTVNREQNQVLNAFDAQFGTPTPATIIQLEEEIAALSVDMQELEVKYLVCKGPLDITLYDIRKEFKAAKDTHALDIGEAKLSFDQSKRVDKEINNTVNSKILPYLLLSINYGQAARVWCKLKKTQLRLKVLLHLIRPTVNGGSNIPVINRIENVHDQNINVTSSRTEA